MNKQYISNETKESTKTAGYRKLQELMKRGKDTWKAPTDKIVILEGWNDRVDFEDIPELAEGILANKGTDPIDVEVLEDGTVVMIDGERRKMAYDLLISQGHTDEWLSYMIAFVVPSDMSKADKKIKKMTANNGKPFKPFEEAHAFADLIADGLSAADIARRVGTNRMHVSNRLTLAGISKIEREFIDDDTISITEWVKLAKAVPDPMRRFNFLLDASKRPDMRVSVEKTLTQQGYTIGENGVAVKPEKGIAGFQNISPAEEEELSPLAEDEERVELSPGIYVIKKKVPPVDFSEERKESVFGQADENGEVIDNKPEHIQSDPKQRSGLSALLGTNTGLGSVRSTTQGTDEPLPKEKIKGLTKDRILTEGASIDSTPITGTVAEALKTIAIQMKALDRHISHDGKMADISLEIDKNLRYVQKIVKNRPDFGKLEWVGGDDGYATEFIK